MHFTLHRLSLAQLSVIREKNTQLAASPLGRIEKSEMYVQHSDFSGGCLTQRAWVRALVGDWPNWDVWGPLRIIESLGAFCCTKEPTVCRDIRQRKIMKKKSANLCLGNYTHKSREDDSQKMLERSPDPLMGLTCGLPLYEASP